MDPRLEDVRRRADDDPGTVGLLLIGSRASGSVLADSDYDFMWVLTDEGMAARAARGELRQVKEGDLDLSYIGIGRVRERIRDLDWATRSLVSSRIVLDKTGELTVALEQMRDAANGRARAEVRSAYDAYLNSYTRSLKSWRRQNELGGRMHAVESVVALVRTLCGVAGRWPPYHDEVERSMPEIETELDLDVLEDMRTIVGTGDPAVQQRLETRVESFMTARGILHEWEDALDDARAWRF